MQIMPQNSVTAFTRPLTNEQDVSKHEDVSNRSTEQAKEVAGTQRPEQVASNSQDQHVTRVSAESETVASRSYQTAEQAPLVGQSDSAETTEEEQQDTTHVSQSAGPKSITGEDLSEGSKVQVQKMKSQDQAVRQHEQAHQAAGGPHAGTASYSYQRGPDGVMYAVGGEVPIDISPVEGDPQATIQKMQMVRAAALAPADPSPQDRSVASRASGIMAEARRERAEEQQGTSQAGDEDAPLIGANDESEQAAHAYQSMAAYGEQSGAGTVPPNGPLSEA